MDIRELERAVKMIGASNSPQMALAAVAGSGNVDGEFAEAAKTLTERGQPRSAGSILSYATRGWL